MTKLIGCLYFIAMGHKIKSDLRLKYIKLTSFNMFVTAFTSIRVILRLFYGGNMNFSKYFTFSIVSILFVCLGFACSADNKSEKSNFSDATATVVVDIASLLNEAAIKHEEVNSVHFRIEHENGGTMVIPDTLMISSEGAVRGTEALTLKIVAESFGFRVNLRIRIIDGKGWLTNPLTNQWEEEDLAIDALFASSLATPQIVREIVEPVFADVELVRGEDAQRITGTIASDLAVKIWGIPSDADLKASDVAVSIWLRKSDDRIVQLQMDGPLVALDADNIVRRITFWDFDVPFEVEAPN